MSAPVSATITSVVRWPTPGIVCTPGDDVSVADDEFGDAIV
jgi:hypothetical protein